MPKPLEICLALGWISSPVQGASIKVNGAKRPIEGVLMQTQRKTEVNLEESVGYTSTVTCPARTSIVNLISYFVIAYSESQRILIRLPKRLSILGTVLSRLLPV